MEAWAQVRRNRVCRGGRRDRQELESYGVDRWLGELARDLKDGTYKPKPVRQVPRKQPRQVPAVGHSLHQGSGGPDVSHARADDLRGRSTPEQYAYRPERSAHDAIACIASCIGDEVVDCDLSNYFGEIPHAELMQPRPTH